MIYTVVTVCTRSVEARLAPQSGHGSDLESPFKNLI